MSITVAFLILVVCFAILAKCADWFVDGAVGIAEHFNVPKMLIGMQQTMITMLLDGPLSLTGVFWVSGQVLQTH